VGALSNFSLFRRQRPAEPGPLVLRQARPSEYEAAIRLILDPAPSFSAEAQVKEFVRLAATSADPAGGVWLAETSVRLESALLPVVSAGRTMLLFIPSDLRAPTRRDATTRLIDAACARAAAAGVHLAQTLLDPRDDSAANLLMACHFSRLAELIYLQGAVPDHSPLPPLPGRTRWAPYSPATHTLFCDTILRIYDQSLDCPGLNGMRDIEDVIAGHKATGEFDPARWLLLVEDAAPLGVMLLSPVPRGDAVEVVYLGLVPDARGRGLGDFMMKHAAHVVAQSPCSRLSLAVDAGNTPALKLYWRHGLQTICRKLAMLRDLRPTPTLPQSP